MSELDAATQSSDPERLARIAQEWMDTIGEEAPHRVPPEERTEFVARGMQRVHGLSVEAAPCTFGRCFGPAHGQKWLGSGIQITPRPHK